VQWTALQFDELSITHAALPYTVPYYTASQYRAFHYTVLHYTALHYTALHQNMLHPLEARVSHLVPAKRSIAPLSTAGEHSRELQDRKISSPNLAHTG
jgi:hypothetical protein